MLSIQARALAALVLALTAAGARGQEGSPVKLTYSTLLPSDTPEQAAIKTTLTELDKQAVQAFARHDWAASEKSLREALRIAEEFYGTENPLLIKILQGLGLVLAERGDHAAAEEPARRILAMTRAGVGNMHPFVATRYRELAENLMYQGRFAEAEPDLRRALDIMLKAADADAGDVATIYGALGANLMEQGRPDEAEPLIRRAYDIAIGRDPASDESATSANNLAQCLERQGRYADAERLQQQAFDINLKLYGEKSQAMVLAYNNLAEVIESQGHLRESEPLLRKALKISLEVNGDTYPDNAYYYNNIAANLLGQGRYRESLPFAEQALALARKKMGDHPLVSGMYSTLAQSLKNNGQAVEAEATAAQAVVIARKAQELAAAGAGQPQTETALRRARASSRQGGFPLLSVYQIYMPVAYAAAKADPSRMLAYQGSAFTVAQDATLSSAAAAMAQAQARATSGGGALGELVARQQALAADAQKTDSQLLAALTRGDAKEAERLKQERETTLLDLATLDAQLARDFPAYTQMVSPGAVPLAELRERLLSDEGLLLVLPTTNPYILVFAISRDHVAWHMADRQAVEKTTKALLAGMTTSGRAAEGVSSDRVVPSAFDRAAAFALYRDLVAPVEGGLAGVKRLYVVASGLLADLPLGLLMTEAPREGSDDSDEALADSDAFLADRYALSYLPSVSSLVVARTTGAVPPAVALAPAAPVPFVGYGAPVLTGSGGSNGRSGVKPDPGAIGRIENGYPLADPAWLRTHFRPLQGTLIELPQMARDLGAPQDSVHLAEKATETAVKADRAVARARIIAFATHGFLPGQVPGVVEPGLVFTPPATASLADDGVLTASEVAQMRLAADWIILSACNTATSDGTGAGAEGLSSLARSFLYAGAGALLASHWAVDDSATAALTTETLAIRRARPALTRAQALQIAMRTVRTGQRPYNGGPLPGWSRKWANPAQWAPFTIITNQDR